MITLAKNKPILYTVRFRILVLLFHYLVALLSAFELAQHFFFSISQDLEVKSLLLEAYVKGQQELLYVVPFVAKVLESSLRSMVINIDVDRELSHANFITSIFPVIVIGLNLLIPLSEIFLDSS